LRAVNTPETSSIELRRRSSSNTFQYPRSGDAEIHAITLMRTRILMDGKGKREDEEGGLGELTAAAVSPITL